MNPIALLIGWGVPAKLAKPLLYALGIGLLLLAFAAAVKLHDRRVVQAHEAQQEIATAKADRKADTNAADQRVADQARLTNESEQIQEATNEARSTGADPRAAYYECVRKQQAARRARKPSPDC